MTYSDTTETARQFARDSICEACDGIEVSCPCHMEDRCDGFKDEAIKIQEEMDNDH